MQKYPIGFNGLIWKQAHVAHLAELGTCGIFWFLKIESLNFFYNPFHVTYFGGIPI